MNNSGIRPLEYKVLVRPKKVEEKTDGGIYLPQDALEKEQWGTTEGELVAIGEIAFTDPDWLDKPRPGDMVLYERHAGRSVKGRDEEEYRLMDDKSIGGVITHG